MINPIIHILDYRTETILGTLENKEGTALFWDDKHKQELKNNQETFDFTMQANVKQAEYVSKQNRIVIQDEDGFYREFIIFQTRQSSDKTKQVYTNASYTELAKQKIIEPVVLEGQTITTAANYVLTGTEWKLGITEFSGTRKIEIEDYKNALEVIRQIASIFELETRFRVEIKGNRIIGRYVDFFEKVGNHIGKEIEFGKDLIGITRVEDFDIVTALVGIGPEKENGDREIVRVYDEDALQRWGRNGHHLWGIYIENTSNINITKEELTRLTKAELEKKINTSVQYEADIASIEHIFGYEHEQVRLGDTVRIKDTSFYPPLYLEARVISIERSISNQSDKTFILGDFIEYEEEDIIGKFKNLKALLDLKESVAKSSTPPENPYHNQLWIDTSDPTQDVWKRWDEVNQIWKEGPGGPPGEDGQSLYTWIKYADSPTSGMSDYPDEKEYIGIAYNKTTPIASTNYNDYTWSLIKGDKGVPGPPGKDGITTYTWIKYADDENGNGMSDSPDGKRYLGIAYNKTTEIESTNPADYSWSPLYDNVEVGGRNLLKDSERERTGSREYIGVNITDIALDNLNKELTISFDLKSTLGESISVYALGRYRWGTKEELDVSTDYQRYSITVTPIDRGEDPNGDVCILSFYGIYDSGNFPTVRRIKIERGNIDTDWTPAIEDIQDQIDTHEIRITTAESTIEQHDTEINLRVLNSTFNSTINDITGEITNLEGRINTAELEIDGLNSQISLKADATYVDDIETRVSSAELEIDGLNSQISLKADKIDLNGYVTISSLKTAGATIINGSNITTGTIRADLIQADTLSTISANLGNITGGNITGVTITGSTIKTSNTNDRLEMSGSSFKSYKAGVKRIELSNFNLNFFDENGVYGGGLHSAVFESSGDLDDQTLLVMDTSNYIDILADASGDRTKYSEISLSSGNDVFNSPGITMQTAINSGIPVTLGIHASSNGTTYGDFRGDEKTYFTFKSRVFIDSTKENNLGFPSGRYVEYKPDSNAGGIINEWILGKGSGYPDANNFWYLHTIFYANLNFRLQIAYGYGNDRMFTRRFNNGVWSAWTEH